MEALIQRLLERVQEMIFRGVPPERWSHVQMLDKTLSGRRKSDAGKKAEPSLVHVKTLTRKMNGVVSIAGDTDVTTFESNEPEKQKVLPGDFRRNFSRNRKSRKNSVTCNVDVRGKDSLKRSNSMPKESSKTEGGEDGSELAKTASDLLLFSQFTPCLSTSNLLEEIEANLSSTCSLAAVLDHTQHTVENLRTNARLCRVGANMISTEEKPQAPKPVGNGGDRLKYLQGEAFIQKKIIQQSEKLLNFCKTRKKNKKLEDTDSLMIYLLAKLRYHLISLEMQRVNLLNEKPRDHNLGEVSITDLYFTLKDTPHPHPGRFVCVAFKSELLLASKLKTESGIGKLHFPVDFKFQGLDKHFVITIELYTLDYELKNKKENGLMLEMKNLFRRTPEIKSKDDESTTDEERYFHCCGSASLTLDELKRREQGKISLSFHTGSDPTYAKTITVHLQSRTSSHGEMRGFLNVCKNTCLKRLWCSLTQFSMNFWTYPEDEEMEKDPIDSIFLPACHKGVRIANLYECIRPHSFTISTNSKDILLSAASQKEMMKWLDNIKSTIEHFHAWNSTF